MNTEQGVMDEDKMVVITPNETFINYVLHTQENIMGMQWNLI